MGKVGSDQISLAYIKNVNEKVDARVLKEVLETFGELKYFDVSRPRVSGSQTATLTWLANCG